MTTHRLSSDPTMPTPTLRAANVASLITRHIELIFTRDTILPLLMPEISLSPQQTSEPPQDQPASKSLPDLPTLQHPPASPFPYYTPAVKDAVAEFHEDLNRLRDDVLVST